MPGTNLTRAEAQERARLLSVDAYEIELDLGGAQEGGTFRSATTVRFEAAEAGSGFIDLVAPHVREVVLNGADLDPEAVFADSRITLDGLVAGANELRVVADCAYTNTGEGLHRFVDPVDEQAYLYTQFEVPDARRVFASFEQPDLKATFQFTVTAPEGWTVVSNSAPEKDLPEPAGEGTALWRFAPTPRISSYITAIIAGPYHSVHSIWESDGRSVPLGLYCRPSLAEFLDADALFEVTRQGFDWFEEKFDYPYPFDEVRPALRARVQRGRDGERGRGDDPRPVRLPFQGDRRGVRGPGRDRSCTNWPTCGSATWSPWSGGTTCGSTSRSRPTPPSPARRTRRAPAGRTPGPPSPNQMKTWAYRQDQLPSTHPIMAEIGDLDDVLVNFDGITYAKGASVLKQLVAYVGMDEFFQGVQRYFKRHAWGNTRLLGPAHRAGGDLRTRSARLVDGLAGDGRHQRAAPGDRRRTAPAPSRPSPCARRPRPCPRVPRAPTLRPHRIAVGLYELEGGRLVRKDRIELDVDGELTPVPELVGRARPAVVLLNDDDLSYAKVRLDAESLAVVTAAPGRLHRVAAARAELGVGLGHDPRRRDGRPRLPGAGALRHHQGVRHRHGAVATAPGEARAGPVRRARVA